MKKRTQHHIAEVSRKRGQVELTIGIDLGDVWSQYCTLNQQGEVIDRGRFRTTAKAIDKWFTDVPHARVAMEAGVHSIWISEQLEQLGHEVIVANVRELRAISHSDRKSDDVDAEKLARYARLDPEILRPISHRTEEQQEALTLIRARELLVRLRTRLPCSLSLLRFRTRHYSKSSAGFARLMRRLSRSALTPFKRPTLDTHNFQHPYTRRIAYDIAPPSTSTTTGEPYRSLQWRSTWFDKGRGTSRSRRLLRKLDKHRCLDFLTLAYGVHCDGIGRGLGVAAAG